jgi:hypothetical protein
MSAQSFGGLSLPKTEEVNFSGMQYFTKSPDWETPNAAETDRCFAIPLEGVLLSAMVR